MQIFAGIPDINQINCPEEYRDFFYAEINPDQLLCIQDAVHIIVKSTRRLLIQHRLRIGRHNIHRSVVENLLKMGPVGQLKKTDLTNTKDAMNYSLGERICSEILTSKLVHPEELATQQYLIMMQHIIKAYIDFDTIPLDRIYSAWRAAFFFRAWKWAVVRDKTTRDYHDNSTQTKSFATRNVQVGAEINAHHILLLLGKCRDEGKPECFLPFDTNSQQCERKFADLRQMGSFMWTSMSFNLKEVLSKVKRLIFLDTTKNSLKDFNFSNMKKQKNKFIPLSLPDNKQCADTVMKAWNDTKEIFQRLGEF